MVKWVAAAQSSLEFLQFLTRASEVSKLVDTFNCLCANDQREITPALHIISCVYLVLIFSPVFAASIYRSSNLACMSAQV